MAEVKKVTGQLLWDFCLELVKAKAGYVWGARGNIYNETEAKFLYENYGSKTYDKKYYFETSMERWGGRIVVDCSGLIQAFRIKYLDKKDDTANGLYQKCSKKGTIGTLPKNLRGVLLFKDNGKGNKIHVGVYGGDNTTIESANSSKGVVFKNPMSTTAWTHWGIPDWLDPTEIINTFSDGNTNILKKCKCMASALNIRNKPNVSGTPLKTFAINDEVNVYQEFNNGWVRVSPTEDEYVNSKYIQQLEAYKVTAFRLNVRDKGNASGNKVRILKNGDIVYIHKTLSNGWVKISTKEEYVNKSYLKKI